MRPPQSWEQRATTERIVRESRDALAYRIRLRGAVTGTVQN